MLPNSVHFGDNQIFDKYDCVISNRLSSSPLDSCTGLISNIIKISFFYQATSFVKLLYISLNLLLINIFNMYIMKTTTVINA